MSKLWIARNVDDSENKCVNYEFGDIEVILDLIGKGSKVFMVMSIEDYIDQPSTISHLGLEVEIEETEEFHGTYFATLKDYKYLKNNKLNRKLYECIGENGDYFVGRKV